MSEILLPWFVSHDPQQHAVCVTTKNVNALVHPIWCDMDFYPEWKMLPYLSVCCKLSDLFTVYSVDFGDAWPELINDFCSISCLLKQDFDWCLVTAVWNERMAAFEAQGGKESWASRNDLRTIYKWIVAACEDKRHATDMSLTCWLHDAWNCVMWEHNTETENL